MTNISLTSFLKILTKGTPQKVNEYNKYLTPGGYDFYWQLKEAAHAHTVGGESFSTCAKPIEETARDVERKHNLEGLKALSKWLKRHNVIEYFDGPASTWPSPEGLLSVKLEPEFGAVVNGQRRLIQIWNSKGATLTRIVAGVGIYLLEKGLCTGEYENCKAGILDLRRSSLFVYDALPRSVQTMVTTELAWADSFFKTHAKAA
jgi:hypothetical protein